VPVTTVLTRDPIATALLRQVKEGHNDLVVVGSRRRGPMRSALLGSVSRQVVRHIPAPVLVVHAEPRESRTADGPSASAGQRLGGLAATS